MELLLLGVLFVFAKNNLQFMDTGIFFYITNFLGYGLIYYSLFKIKDEVDEISRILPFCAS